MQKLSAEHTASSQGSSESRAAGDALPRLPALAVVQGWVMVPVEAVGSEVVVRTRDRSLELDPGVTLVSTRNFLLPPLIAGSGLSWKEVKKHQFSENKMLWGK